MKKKQDEADQGGVQVRVDDPRHEYPEGIPVVLPPDSEDVPESSDSGSKNGQTAAPQKKESSPMVAPTTPAKKLSNGRDTWWLVPTVASLSAPTAANVNMTTNGLNVTGMLLSDYEGATTSTEKVTLPKVLLEVATTEVQGETTTSLGDMQLTFQPQAAAGSDGKKAWELFSGGVYTGYAIRRQDMVGTTGDAAAGQFVDVFPISAVRNTPTKTSTGPDGIYIFSASIGVTGAPAYNVAVVA